MILKPGRDQSSVDLARCRGLIARFGLGMALLAALGGPLPTAAAADESPATHKDKSWTRFFQRRTGWTAGDGATSVPLSDGRVIWLFGDSHVNDFDEATGTLPLLFQVRNAAFVHPAKSQDQADAQLLNAPHNHDLFVHPDGGKHWFWPQAGFETHGSVYVYLTALKPRGEPGPWDFQGIGHYWAKMPLGDLNDIAYTALLDMNGVDYGCGFVPDDEPGYTLAFGQKSAGLETLVYLARFKTAAPERDWMFWDGERWATEAAAAAPVTRCASFQVTACKLKHRFVLASGALSVRCDMGKEIYISTSDRPTGPFSPIKKIYTLDDTVEGHTPFFYIPAMHPEFTSDNDELLITYSINGYEPCVPLGVNGRMNPDHYRPKAIRVPLELIDPSLATAANAADDGKSNKLPSP